MQKKSQTCTKSDKLLKKKHKLVKKETKKRN